MYQIISTHLYI